jgi:acetate kinase
MRIVSCHLGAGASLCAIDGGRSVDTTMCFTPLEGLVMATRSGSVDPGRLLWLLEREALSEAEMASALEHESGLAGLAGTAQMEAVLARAADGDGQAVLAIDVYIHRLRSAIASMMASLGAIDALVFTGGVGEHAPVIRSRACAGLSFLGIEIDEAANAGATGDVEITADGAAVRVVVVRAREDLEMARQAEAALSG